jgi:hypothetical protein
LSYLKCAAIVERLKPASYRRSAWAARSGWLNVGTGIGGGQYRITVQ